MIRTLAMLVTAATLAAGASALTAQEATKAQAKKPAAAKPVTAKPAAKSTTASPKAGAGEKVCRHKFPTGEKRAWVCKKEEPCCAWDEISYVKCGSTITGCL